MESDNENVHIQEVYEVLIDLIRQNDEEEGLIVGNGNFGIISGSPAFPRYTGCRLTHKGSQLAEVLFEKFPEYREE
jgi:DNA gyrase/topoisomerase IV subunit A